MTKKLPPQNKDIARLFVEARVSYLESKSGIQRTEQSGKHKPGTQEHLAENLEFVLGGILPKRRKAKREQKSSYIKKLEAGESLHPGLYYVVAMLQVLSGDKPLSQGLLNRALLTSLRASIRESVDVVNEELGKLERKLDKNKEELAQLNQSKRLEQKSGDTGSQTERLSQLIKRDEERFSKLSLLCQTVNRAEKQAKLHQRKYDRVNFPWVSKTRLPTLVRLDEILTNSYILTGSSHEHPPSTRRDLFRRNARLSDVMFAPMLTSCEYGVEIITDRLLIDMKVKERRDILGTRNLICVGGPEVNVATRRVSRFCVHRLEHPPAKGTFDERREDGEGGEGGIFDFLCAQEVLSKPDAVRTLHDILSFKRRNKNDEFNPEGRHLKPGDIRELQTLAKRIRNDWMGEDEATYEQIMRIFIPQQIFVPNTLRYVPYDDSVAVITLGANPWADKESGLVSIMVAGKSEYGTARAMFALWNEISFKERPLGGVLKINLASSVSDYHKFKQSSYSWSDDTQSYTVDGLIDVLEQGAEAIRGGNRRRFQTLMEEFPLKQEGESAHGKAVTDFFYLDDLNEYISFIKKFREPAKGGGR